VPERAGQNFAHMYWAHLLVRWHMPSAQDILERARMFDGRADRATDPISRQHYREMAAHYRSLSVEHRVKRAPQLVPAYESVS
jgi:hypothetical protein